MPFGYAERAALSADSLAECWRWLQRPGGSVGSLQHVFTKQESRQQEAGTQVPPPPHPSGIDGYGTVGLFSKQKQQGWRRGKLLSR